MNGTRAESTLREVTRYLVNPSFTEAILVFTDGSWLQFEHSSRQNRWAKASKGETQAEHVCNSLRQFRLNAKHLQLFFEDGSNAEFFARISRMEESDHNDVQRG